jgi:hypothetical protein
MWDWIQGNPQLVSALVAAFAFLVALSQFTIARTHNKNSVRPLLLHEIKQNVVPIQKGSLVGPSVKTERVLYSEWSFVISNQGLGPAIVKDCVFSLDSKCFTPLTQEHIEKTIQAAFPYPDKRPQVTYRSIVSGTVIAKDAEISVLKLQARNPNEAFELTHVLLESQADFVLRFKTMDNQRFVYDTRLGTGQKRVWWWNPF